MFLVYYCPTYNVQNRLQVTIPSGKRNYNRSLWDHGERRCFPATTGENVSKYVLPEAGLAKQIPLYTRVCVHVGRRGTSDRWVCLIRGNSLSNRLTLEGKKSSSNIRTGDTGRERMQYIWKTRLSTRHVS